jgi:hypothetical protein
MFDPPFRRPTNLRGAPVIVCVDCGEPWDKHIAMLEDDEADWPDHMVCITLLKRRHQGPPGPPGPAGRDARDPAQTSDPPGSLIAFLDWLQRRDYLSTGVGRADFDKILGQYWSSP